MKTIPSPTQSFRRSICAQTRNHKRLTKATNLVEEIQMAF
jgi:hypothetical protein